VVVGSLNMDLVVEVPTIPRPGETILGDNFATFPGGKGANQAVAAARLGARVSLIGRVGQDAFGDQLLASARADGVSVSHVGRDDTAATGVAMITVDERGQNSIAVASGANFRLTADHVREAWALLEKPDVLAMPLETPLETIAIAVELACRSEATVVLNPAPARSLPAEIMASVDVLVPNEPETEHLTGMSISTLDASRAAGRQLFSFGVSNVVLTLGSQGALVLEGNADQYVLIPAYRVDAVDTTAAGDAFVGGIAVGLSEGKSLAESARFASAVGALAVTKLGAQPSLPTLAEVVMFLSKQ
jgi:ribokinase